MTEFSPSRLHCTLGGSCSAITGADLSRWRASTGLGGRAKIPWRLRRFTTISCAVPMTHTTVTMPRVNLDHVISDDARTTYAMQAGPRIDASMMWRLGILKLANRGSSCSRVAGAHAANSPAAMSSMTNRPTAQDISPQLAARHLNTRIQTAAISDSAAPNQPM